MRAHLFTDKAVWVIVHQPVPDSFSAFIGPASQVGICSFARVIKTFFASPLFDPMESGLRNYEPLCHSPR